MTPLEQAWEYFGGTLLGTSGKVKAKCPLHADANASARVDTLEQKWVCYAGCGYGDIYELVKLADGIDDFRECKEWTDTKFGTAPKRPVRAAKKGKKKSWV